MNLSFQKASKKSAKLRMSLIGVAGSGKTYTALNIAKHLGGPVAVIDTEHGSASKYSDVFEFDVLELETFSPQTYIEAIRAADEAGYNVLIIDSLSHAWTGKEGALEQVDRVAKRQQTNNTFGAWRDVTPLHNAMVDTIIASRLHIIATMRAKTEYVQEKNDKTGRTTVRKVGMAPVQRDGLEYEFDVVADLDQDNNLIVGKTRCPAIAGQVIPKAGKEIANKLTAWLSDGSSNANRVSSFSAATAKAAKERANPEQTTAATPLADVSRGSHDDHALAEDGATVLCNCGIEAKYIRGKSANGWVCGHHGTRAPMCDFRKKDTVPEPEEDFAEPHLFEDNMAEHADADGNAGLTLSANGVGAFTMNEVASANGHRG
ncbi:MAG: ATP-binding protein [Abitibacteriaceae bacterium]|nr:ATP-binding protein [Abditibacteriaceae bacterium]